MIESLDELKEAIKQRLSKIIFDSHFYDSMKKRPYLSEGLVISMLKEFERYLGFQTHEVRESIRYRVGISLSRKYTLVVVVEVNESLNIKTSWKTSRKWQKAIQK
ncbi:hypothetical protein J4233_05225 [Candidatus Pacearchaeota archaeon]|nr:hypothetical protein [Candidatus Pacearchaeota archaeon]